MKKILASLAAAGVLVAGVATAAVVTGSSAAAQETPDDDTTTVVERPERGEAIRDVLEELAASGEIQLSETEIDTILEALEEKWEELRANRPQGHRGHGFRRGFHRGAGFGFHIRELLEDGVIDAAELAELPDGHPLTDTDGPFAEALADDGQISQQEFEDVIAELREEMQERFGDRGFGPRFGEDAEPDVEGISL